MATEAKRDTEVRAGAGAQKKSRERQAVIDRVKMMMHIERGAILQHLIEHGVKSPKQLSIELGKDLGSVSYHVRTLEQHDCVTLVDTKQRRGATEHFYRHTELAIIDTSEWDLIPEHMRIGFMHRFAQVMVDHITIGALAGTLGQDENYVMTATAMRALDRKGYEAMQDAHEALFERTIQIQEEATERLAASGEAPIMASSSQAFFEVPHF